MVTTTPNERQTRVIRWQHRQRGLIHLTAVVDSVYDGTCHVSYPTRTFCGQSIVGGGWGYGARQCPECWSQGAPAEKLPW